MNNHVNMMSKKLASGLNNKKEKLIIDAITKHLGYLPDKELLIANLRKVINTDNYLNTLDYCNYNNNSNNSFHDS